MNPVVFALGDMFDELERTQAHVFTDYRSGLDQL